MVCCLGFGIHFVLVVGGGAGGGGIQRPFCRTMEDSMIRAGCATAVSEYFNSRDMKVQNAFA